MLVQLHDQQWLSQQLHPEDHSWLQHHCKLAAILAEASKNHKSLVVFWLDLVNAYSSIHHSLIQFLIWICHYYI